MSFETRSFSPQNIQEMGNRKVRQHITVTKNWEIWDKLELYFMQNSLCNSIADVELILFLCEKMGA